MVKVFLVLLYLAHLHLISLSLGVQHLMDDDPRIPAIDRFIGVLFVLFCF